MPLPTSAARLAPDPSPTSISPMSPWQAIWRSPQWMVLAAFVVRVAWIAIAHTYRIRTTEHNFGFGFETGRIAYSLAHGMGFSSPFGGDTGPSAWTAPIYPWIVSLAFRAFGSYSQAAAFARTKPWRSPGCRPSEGRIRLSDFPERFSRAIFPRLSVPCSGSSHN